MLTVTAVESQIPYFFVSVMCEFCGKLGVRDAFYSKTKRFCSVNCSKRFSAHEKDGKATPFSLMQTSIPKVALICYSFMLNDMYSKLWLQTFSDKKFVDKVKN